MMPDIVIRLLATLAILCQLAPLGTGVPSSAPPGHLPPGEGMTAAEEAGERKHTGEAETDTERLACAIYNEAGGDACSDECRRYVGDVVLNRVADIRFPDTIEGVLTAPAQYGRFSKTGIVWPERAQNAGEAHAVERAYRIADELLAGEHSELYGQGYVWQAEFVQGAEGFWCDGLYFGR